MKNDHDCSHVQASEPARPRDAIEDEIDALDDDDLAALFRRTANWDQDPDMTEDDVLKACSHSIVNFRNNPNGAVYRGYIRDALLAMHQRNKTNTNPNERTNAII